MTRVDTKSVVHVPVAVRDGETEALPYQNDTPRVGDWFQVRFEAREDEDGRKHEDIRLGCVVHVGSNYVEMEGKGGWNTRVLSDDFHDICTPEFNWQHIIDNHVAENQLKAKELLGQVQLVMARLGLGQRMSLTDGAGETQALALRNEQAPNEYKTALVRAKKETLPELFQQVRGVHEELAAWMQLPLIPLKAQSGTLTEQTEKIEGRIFSVELYAGLTENVVQFADGKPATEETPIHLFQRRCYMDEESLVDYQAGGMEFADLNAFDEWMARPKNRDRILPMPRCVVAFRVRRSAKEREAYSLADFFEICKLERMDEFTFLYIRNGERLYRLNTALDFGEKLFPDLDNDQLTGSLYAVMDSHRPEVKGLITEGNYLERMRQNEEADARHAEALKVYKNEYAAWEKRQADAEKAGEEFHECWPSSPWHRSPFEDRYEPFSDKSVYYDDIAKFVHAEMERHNRIALIFQGLLDRSPIFHPHPPWRLWTPEGFTRAFKLAYDESRAFTSGKAPDFKEYQAKLNAQIKPGSIVIGAEKLWLEEQVEIENARRKRRGESRGDVGWFRPFGDDGPGNLAPVVSVRGKGTARTITFMWDKNRSNWNSNKGRVRKKFTTRVTDERGVSRVFNASAYRPGDFHQFFDDPRTRADYLQWAPYLLVAEDFHAGKRQARDPVDGMKPVKPEASWEAKVKYEEQRRHKLYVKRFLRKQVRLVETTETEGGTKFKKGDVMLVRRVYRRHGFTNLDLQRVLDSEVIWHMNVSSVELLSEEKWLTPPEKPVQEEN